MLTNEQRRAVVAEARTWIGTRYHPMGRVKGAGVDCAMLLCEVFEKAGIVDRVEVPYYPPDWHLHSSAERYLEAVLRRGREKTWEPLPADVLLVRFGRCFSHGAIVMDWPICIHAMVRYKVGYVNAELDPRFFEKSGVRREMKLFEVGA